MLTIEQFCDKHNACDNGRRWALDNCTTMQEAWDKCKKPDWLIWIATRRGVLDDKSLRLFAVYCCRQIQHLMKDPRSIAAVDAAEQFDNGLITIEQLAAAKKAAYAAIAIYIDAGAYDTVTAATAAAATTAADVANAAFWTSNKLTRQNLVNHLRQNCKPNFT